MRNPLQRLKWLADRKLRRNIRYKAYRIICRGPIHCMCSGCTVTQLKKMQADHVLGNGDEHRKIIGRSELALLRLVISGKYPWDEFPLQALCEQCHLSRHKNHGICRFFNKNHEWGMKRNNAELLSSSGTTGFSGISVGSGQNVEERGS